MDIKRENIIKKYFVNYRDLSDQQQKELISECYFFDTENSPVFEDSIVSKYDLKNKEYNTLEDFKISNDDNILDDLLKENKIKTNVYCWMFGGNNTNTVVWGNTLEEFEIFITTFAINNNITDTMKIYVHNLAWDLEFFKYYFKENNFKEQNIIGLRKNDNLERKKEYSFSITQNDGIVYGCDITYSHFEGGQVQLNFKDSYKVAPISLKAISKIIKIDDIYQKDEENIKYNLVRDTNNYIPKGLESWYCYCDIYILKEWYNQLIKDIVLKEGIQDYTVSQIAFDSILAKTYKLKNCKENYMYYRKHFALDFIEKNKNYMAIIKNSYKGGICTVGKGYKDKTEFNKVSGVSCDATSHYPSQMAYKPLPYGKPLYTQGKYKDIDTVDKDGNKELYNYHITTIAFDYFKPKDINNKMGLNIKILGLTDKERKILNIGSNEYVTSNVVNGVVYGENKILGDSELRKIKLKKYLNRRFIITVHSQELEQWLKEYDFYIDDLPNSKAFKEVDKEDNLIYIDTLSFKSECGHFNDGLLYYYDLKDKADLNNDSANKFLAKNTINSFYGKHCSTSLRCYKKLNLDNNIISYQSNLYSIWSANKSYAWVYGSGVTAWGRTELRRHAQLIDNTKFIYADTDSLKFELTLEEFKEKVKNVENNKYNTDGVSFCKEDKKLGWWDLEYTFEDIKVIGQKKYMYSKDGVMFKTKCAGLPSDVRDKIKVKKDFSYNKEYIKRSKRRVQGGYLQIESKYKLKDLLLN